MRRSGVRKERIGTRATLDRGAWVKNLTIKIEVKEKNNRKEKKGRIEQRKAQRRGKKQVVELWKDDDEEENVVLCTYQGGRTRFLLPGRGKRARWG